MNKLYNDNEIIDLIKNNNMVVIYFTGSMCGACEIIKIKIEDILKRFPKIKSGEINVEKYLDIAAKHNVFSVPIFFTLYRGKGKHKVR